MSVAAVVMAGGRGRRMGLPVEKPLLRVGGKPVVELVVDALRCARSVGRVVVAVSGFTPLTAEFVRGLGVEVVETPGREYVSDMGFAVKKLGLGTVLAVAADLPLLTGAVIDDVLERYRGCGKPALAVAVPFGLRERLGLGVGYAFDWRGERVVFAGINVNDGRRIDDAELEQEVYVVDKVEVAVNINTVDELRIAEEQFRLLRKT
jgi:adenosylcobinamide-phosphate guanylyltransferase